MKQGFYIMWLSRGPEPDDFANLAWKVRPQDAILPSLRSLNLQVEARLA
jgi:hypothetical protein